MLHRHRWSGIDSSIRESDLGVTPEAVDLKLPLEDLAPLKMRARAAHASQLDEGNPESFLRPGLVTALLQEEWFAVASGAPSSPGSNDPFEGLN